MCHLPFLGVGCSFCFLMLWQTLYRLSLTQASNRSLHCMQSHPLDHPMHVNFYRSCQMFSALYMKQVRKNEMILNSDICITFVNKKLTVLESE